MDKKIIRTIDSTGCTTGYAVIWYDEHDCQRRRAFAMLADADAFLATLP